MQAEREELLERCGPTESRLVPGFKYSRLSLTRNDKGRRTILDSQQDESLGAQVGSSVDP